MSEKLRGVRDKVRKLGAEIDGTKAFSARLNSLCDAANSSNLQSSLLFQTTRDEVRAAAAGIARSRPED